MKFEWNETKRRENLRKHSIDFVDVVAVFSGETLTYEDSRFDYGEQRFITISLLRDMVVLIAHTEVTGESVRIIHARKASRKTAAQYFARFSN